MVTHRRDLEGKPIEGSYLPVVKSVVDDSDDSMDPEYTSYNNTDHQHCRRTVVSFGMRKEKTLTDCHTLLQFPHRVPFNQKKMPWCPCPF